jgi:hypothetical protein
VQRVESEIVAWRGWQLGEDDDGPLLRSFNNTPWTGPVLTADKEPDPGHNHGIYALGQRPDWRSPNASYFLDAAYGEVGLSGLVIEGGCGYRAERAVVRSLYVGNPERYGPLGERMCAWEIAGLLGERYGVEVDVPLERWAKLTSEWRDTQERARSRLLFG